MKDVDLLDGYAGLASGVADAARAAAERIRVHGRVAGESIVAIGLELTVQKAALGHGRFGAWIEAEFGWGAQHARRFMAVAERYGGETRIMRDLAPTALYALAAPSTPDEVRAAVEEAVAEQKAVTSSTIANLKKQYASIKAAMDVADRQRLEAIAAERARAAAAVAELKESLSLTAQAEVDALRARIAELEADPVWDIMKATLKEALEGNAEEEKEERRRKREEQKEKNAEREANRGKYAAYNLMLTVIGPIRALAENVLPQVSPESVMVGFVHEHDQASGMKSARKVRDYLNQLLELDQCQTTPKE